MVLKTKSDYLLDIFYIRVKTENAGREVASIRLFYPLLQLAFNRMNEAMKPFATAHLSIEFSSFVYSCLSPRNHSCIQSSIRITIEIWSLCSHTGGSQLLVPDWATTDVWKHYCCCVVGGFCFTLTNIFVYFLLVHLSLSLSLFFLSCLSLLDRLFLPFPVHRGVSNDFTHSHVFLKKNKKFSPRIT